MAPQITIPWRANTFRNSSECARALVLHRSSLYFSRQSSERRSRYPRALSRAIDCRRHCRRCVASRSIRLVLYSFAIRGTRFHSTSSRLLSSLGTSVRPTRCNKFAIVPHNCRKPRAENPSAGPCDGDGDLAPRATRITRGLLGIFPRHYAIREFRGLSCSIRREHEYDEKDDETYGFLLIFSRFRVLLWIFQYFVRI